MSPKFPDADDESICAARIIADALAEAIDAAIEAGISAECFAIAVLSHICEVLADQFMQTPDDIAAIARRLAAAYAGAPEVSVLNNHGAAVFRRSIVSPAKPAAQAADLGNSK